MTLISKLKSLLGLDAGGRDHGGTTVAVEPEPRTDTERAVKESPGPTREGPSTEPADTAGAETARPSESPDENADEPVESLSGIGPAYAERLNEAGVETVRDLAAADAAELAAATDLGEGRVANWIERAKGG